MFTSPSQILCTVLGVRIYYYGVILAAAIAVGTLVSDYFGTKFFKLEKETVIDMAPYLIICGILGARIYYCIMDFSYYLKFPTEILAIRHGGISIHGAIIGGIIGLLIYSRRKRISFPKLCDVSVIGLSIAQALGRWGNFFNSEAYGKPTELPWKLYIAPEFRQIPYQNNEYFHPAFLYESILDICVFVILVFIMKKFSGKIDGVTAGAYLVLYSVVRLLVEQIRIDSALNVGNFHIAQLISILMLVVGIAWICIIKFKKTN
mgnify:CR=1 FL=1